MINRLLPGLVSLGVAVAARRVLGLRSTEPRPEVQTADILPSLVGLVAASALGAWLDRRSASRLTPR
jgi:hypothetical protein